MQASASVLIAILHDALRRVEEDSQFSADDPALLDLKASIQLGIAELEILRSSEDQLEAA
jgi:hypothetical protein